MHRLTKREEGSHAIAPGLEFTALGSLQTQLGAVVFDRHGPNLKPDERDRGGGSLGMERSSLCTAVV